MAVPSTGSVFARPDPEHAILQPVRQARRRQDRDQGLVRTQPTDEAAELGGLRVLRVTQNDRRAPSWIWRMSPAVRILPKVAGAFKAVPGLE